MSPPSGLSLTAAATLTQRTGGPGSASCQPEGEATRQRHVELVLRPFRAGRRDHGGVLPIPSE
jgi:hypothetical protein